MSFFRKFATYTLLIVLAFANAGCSKESDVYADCPAVLDTVQTLLTQEYKGKTYVLVKRIAGWHDKTEIIQLFNEPPRLNECNKDLVAPIFEDSIETNKPLIKLKVNISSNMFEFEYGEIDVPLVLELTH